jgi:methylmalonyl-CoA mutase
LNNIDWQYCNLSFTGNEQHFVSLSDYIQNKNYKANILTGTFYWKSITEKRDAIIKHLNFTTQNSFIPLGLIIEPSTPVTEISETLRNSVSVIQSLVEKNIPVEKAIRSIAFSITSDKDFLSTIAKLKALRMLWYQVTQAFGVTSYVPDDLHLHVESTVWLSEKYQPQSNMIKSTTSALASVLGGGNALTITPEQEDNTTMNRIACNVSNILREESYLDKISDPLAGCYALEEMIDGFAKHAWKKFQSTMQ